MPIIRKMFHTQGHRRLPYLTKPLMCKRDDAWLGIGYYFWYEEQDAIYWGQVGKRSFGRYVVYSANVNCENVLDTVFNEEHYLFWYKIIDKIADDILLKTGRKPSIKQVNYFLKEKNVWKDITGIMFQDLPNNQLLNKVITLLYRKRIQVVVFDINIVSNFAHHFEAAC
jgi:hypothetical protein